jgi:hypothetical protein
MVGHRSVQRSVASVLLATLLGGCTSWRVETPSPAALGGNGHPAEIRVEYSDGRSEVLYQPEVRGDSLIGKSRESVRQADRAVALVDVRRIATRHINAAGTAGLLLGVGAVIGIIVGLSSIQGPFDNWGQ